MRRPDRHDAALLIAIGFAVGVTAWVGSWWRAAEADCGRRGGVLVRAGFGWTCVREAAPDR